MFLEINKSKILRRKRNTTVFSPTSPLLLLSQLHWKLQTVHSLSQKTLNVKVKYWLASPLHYQPIDVISSLYSESFCVLYEPTRPSVSVHLHITPSTGLDGYWSDYQSLKAICLSQSFTLLSHKQLTLKWHVEKVKMRIWWTQFVYCTFGSSDDCYWWMLLVNC